jgi:hypothetical protein
MGIKMTKYALIVHIMLGFLVYASKYTYIDALQNEIKEKQGELVFEYLQNDKISSESQITQCIEVESLQSNKEISDILLDEQQSNKSLFSPPSIEGFFCDKPLCKYKEPEIQNADIYKRINLKVLTANEEGVLT